MDKSPTRNDFYVGKWCVLHAWYIQEGFTSPKGKKLPFQIEGDNSFKCTQQENKLVGITNDLGEFFLIDPDRATWTPPPEFLLGQPKCFLSQYG